MADNTGWVKSFRKMLDNPVVCKDVVHFGIWNYLLLSASHSEKRVVFGGVETLLNRGSLVTGRKKIAETLKVSESKVERVLTCLENEQLIKQQKSNKNRIITILNWDKYQSGEQQIEQQMNNNWTTTEQQVNTNKNIKNIKNNINSIHYVHTVCPSGEGREVEQVLEAWNRLPDVQHVSRISSRSNRAKMLKARIRDYGVQSVLNAVNRIRGSDFLRGKNKDGWTITFDWFVRPNNFPKVLEGNYDNKDDSDEGIKKTLEDNYRVVSGSYPVPCGKEDRDAFMDMLSSVSKENKAHVSEVLTRKISGYVEKAEKTGSEIMPLSEYLRSIKK